MPSIPALAKPYVASKSAFFAGSSSESYSSYLKPSVIDNLSETVISSIKYNEVKLYPKSAAASYGFPDFALFAKKELAFPAK